MKRKLTEAELATADEIMDAVVQTQEWERIQKNDPQIKAADQALDAVMAQAKGILPKRLWIDLSDNIVRKCAAYGDAGILYGIHAAEVIRAAAEDQVLLSTLILRRMEEMAK